MDVLVTASSCKLSELVGRYVCTRTAAGFWSMLAKISKQVVEELGLNTPTKYRPAFNGGTSPGPINNEPPGGSINAALSKSVVVGCTPRLIYRFTGPLLLAMVTVSLLPSGGTSTK